MDKPMPASCSYLISLYAAITAVDDFLKTGVLPKECIVLRDERGAFIVKEADWSFLLPDAIHDVATNTNLDPDQYDRLNAFIAAKQFKMQEMGFSDSYPVPLDDHIPTEHDPQMDEEIDADEAEGEQL